MKNLTAIGLAFTPIIIYAYLIITWVINLIQFLNCDFEGPYREEIIHGVGIVLPLCGITVWM